MDAERRIAYDRRARPTPMMSRYTFFGGRRRGGRRAGDTTAIYVDQVGLKAGLVLILIFIFHCLDAGFTLFHLARGGRELNPLMDFYIRIGPGAFLGVKLGLAAIGLSFLGLHKNFPYVRQGILFLFLLYAGVVAYHLHLIFGS
jgi:hypothetical protein